MITFPKESHHFEKATFSIGYLKTKFCSGKHFLPPLNGPDRKGSDSGALLVERDEFRKKKLTALQPQGVREFGATLADVSDTGIAKLMTRLTF